MGGRLCRIVFATFVLVPFVVGDCRAAEGNTPEQPQKFLVAAMRVMPQRFEKEYNFELLRRFATEAAQKRAKLVVTCEGFLDGYTSNTKFTPGLTREKYLEIGETLDGPYMKRIAALSSELSVYLSVGFAERRGQEMYNSVVVYSPEGEVVLHYSKTHTKGETFNKPGMHFPVAKSHVGTLGALICYDRRFPEVARILALKGAQILIVPAYGTDGERNEALLRTRAWENSVWVVYAKQNQALVINPSGTIIARDQGDHDQLVLAEIELDENVGTGDILDRRAGEFYREIIEIQPRTE